MRVRMAEEKDIERIHSLLAQVAMVHHKGRPDLFKYGKSKYTDEELKEILKDENRPILAAVDDNDCLQGYAFCIFQQYKDNNIMTDIKTLYIDDLCVEETRRGEHIGKTLYNAALDFAREHGCYNVTLNVWSCNESAMKFYRSCGLKEQKVGMEVIL
ncbi:MULTISPECIES: GNAT family N-acetyltransferase [Eubacteriales]|uniref:GNAT family N-acetyltransferase n=2 Tax=Faecalicatena fissicatena TaxID=290055 RepID=A0ABS2E681_9FIRM|nr:MULTISPECIES: GNAT family N-acetyltransferase [Clostridia]MBM6737138.1 GNAT family N-acetyltransferase [Faecalicatena fissicatena]HIX98066.1 GNAT family N-acetyltransferase [Candidatus Dorea intestinigallinarum]